MNLRSVLSSAGVVVAPEDHHHVTDSFIGVDCPKCSPRSRRFLCGISRDGSLANCWQCGRMPVFSLVRQLILEANPVNGPSIASEAIDYLRAGIPHTGRVPPVNATLRPLKTIVPAGVGPLLAPHKRYLERRGYDPAHLESFWGIRGIGLASRLAWRLFIPIYSGRDLASWTTRSLSDKVSRGKYLNAEPHEEAVSKKELIYGAEFCRNAIVVVEGPLDAVKGGPGFGATMGLSYSRAQLLKIASYPVRAICFDSEPEAQRRARKLADSLALFDGETHVVELESGKDMSRADHAEIQEVRKRFLD